MLVERKLLTGFSLTGSKGEVTQSLTTFEIAKNLVRVNCSVDFYLLHALARNDELYAGGGEDGSDMAFVTTTFPINNSRGDHFYSRETSQFAHYLRGRISERGVRLASFPVSHSKFRHHIAR